MPSTASRSHSPLVIDLYWDPDCLEGVALTVVDVLRAVQRIAAMRAPRARPPVVWRWKALGATAVPRSLPRCDGAPKGLATVAVVPGWHASSGPHLDRLVRASASAVQGLQAVHAAGGALAFVYNGAALAARTGLLDGQRAAVPWAFMASVLRQSDRVQLETVKPWLGAQRLWTCDAPVWTTAVLLDLLRQCPAPGVAALAESVAHVLLPTPVRRQVAALNVQGAHERILPAGAVERARRWLEAHLDQPYDLQATAEAAATSARTLLRHFAQAHGQSPLDYLHGLRMARAQVLLETSYVSVEQIAQMCGYTDVGTFRRLFVRATGTRPSDYRARHRLRASRRQWGVAPSEATRGT